VVKDHQERNRQATSHRHLQSKAFPHSNHKPTNIVLLERSHVVTTNQQVWFCWSTPTQQPQTIKYDFAKALPRAPRIILLLPRAPLKTKITSVLLEVRVPLTTVLCFSLCLSFFPYVLLKCVHSRSCVGSFCFSSSSDGHGHHLHNLCSLCFHSRLYQR